MAKKKAPPQEEKSGVSCGGFGCLILVVVILAVAWFAYPYLTGQKHLPNPWDQVKTDPDPEPDKKPVSPILVQHKCLPVYYYDGEAQYFVPIHFTSDDDAQPVGVRAQKILEKIVAGPPVDGLMRIIPDGTKINSVKSEGDLIIVDLSSDLASYGGGSTWERGIVQSIILSLTELPGIKRVQFLIDGQKMDYLPQGTMISEPISREGGPNSNEYLPEGKTSGYLYYVENSGQFLVPVYWAWEGEKNDPKAKLESLYASPGPPLSHSLISPAPSGIRIEKCVIASNKLTLIIDHHDFNNAFADRSAEKFLEATILSMYQFSPFSSVDIKVGDEVNNRPLWSYSAFENLQNMEIPPSCYNQFKISVTPRI